MIQTVIQKVLLKTARSAQTTAGLSKGKKRKMRMSSFDLSEIIIRKGIKTRSELLAYANQQKSQGKYDIAEFIVNRCPRVVAEVLTTAWEMNTAQEKLDRAKKSRIEILEEASQGECAAGCNGQWLTVLRRYSSKMVFGKKVLLQP